MKVIIDGVDLSTFGRVMDLRKDMLPPRDWSTINIPTVEGAYLGSKTVSPRMWEIDFKFIGDVETQRRGLAAILESDKPLPLEYGDLPNVRFYGVFTGESLIDREAHTGNVTLQFLIPDPYGIGSTQTATIGAGNETVNLFVNSDAAVWPIITATFQAGSSFFALANDEGQYIMIGDSGDAEREVIPYEQRILWDEMDSVSEWAPWNGKTDGGEIAGTMQSNGNRFYASDTGEGGIVGLWHGPARVRTLPMPLQDFLIEFRATQTSTTPDQEGRVELYLLDANGRQVAKLIIRDSDPFTITNYAFARLGEGDAMRYLIDHKDTRLNNFNDGTLRIRRDGLQINANIARYDAAGNITHQVGGKYYDIYEQYQAPITQIAIAIQQRGDRPLSQSYANDIKVYKLNQPQDYPNTTDQLFYAGDQLKINMKTGLVTKNGTSIVGKIHPQSDFFKLKPGGNSLGVRSAGGVSVNIEYERRWI